MVLLTPAPLGRQRSPLPHASSNPVSARDSAGARLELDGVRVVVVEDDPDSRDMLVAIFAAAGADVSSAASAEEGFDLVSLTSPQLLVSDIAMPDEDGYSLMRRVRASELAQGGSIPAIALTAFTSDDARRSALRAGFSLHMSKPVDPPAILAAAKRLTEAPPS